MRAGYCSVRSRNCSRRWRGTPTGVRQWGVAGGRMVGAGCPRRRTSTTKPYVSPSIGSSNSPSFFVQSHQCIEPNASMHCVQSLNCIACLCSIVGPGGWVWRCSSPRGVVGNGRCPPLEAAAAASIRIRLQSSQRLHLSFPAKM